MIARGIMGVEMNGNADLLFQRADQKLGCVGLAQTCHVFDRQEVRAQLFQLPGQLHVIFQVVLGPVWIQDVARVADRRLTEHAGVAHGLNAQPQVRDPVERVEDAEKIDPGLGRLLDECFDDVVWIVRVTHRIGGAQEHLQQNIRDALAQFRQPVPGRFLEKTHRRVKRSSAPHFQGE